MDVITKASAQVEPGTDDADSPHGTFAVILSTATLDRDGEEVKSSEWELPLPGHITFDVDHGMSVASTVGSGRPQIDSDGRLVVHGTYASTPLAQQTRALVNEGHIKSTSVAFLRKTSKTSKDGKPVTVVARELLNGAFVAVPANREALVLESKALALKLGARNNATDAQNIQAAHDLMTSLGAVCAKPGAAAPPKPGPPKPGPVKLGPVKPAAPKPGPPPAKAVTPDTEPPADTATDPAVTADPKDLAAQLDAGLDAAMTLANTLDLTALPDEVTQLVDAITAADALSDDLLDAMGITDPDEDSTDAPPDQTASAAATTASAAVTAEHAARLAVTRTTVIGLLTDEYSREERS